MNCIFCDNKIPDRANFCPNCKEQVKCLSCSETLEKGSEICVICGQEKKTFNKDQNVIEYNETKKSKSFKANFSNEVGTSIGEALNMIMLNNSTGKFNASKKTLNVPKNVDDVPTIDTDFTEVKIPLKADVNDRVYSIFNDEQGIITLLETRLKAVSKRDYGIRLSIIFLYYKLLKGFTKIERNELNSIMKDASLYDGNFRKWLVNNNLIGVHDESIELKAPGREKAKEYVIDIYDDNKADQWKLGSAPRRKRKKESGEESHE